MVDKVDEFISFRSLQDSLQILNSQAFIDYVQELYGSICSSIGGVTKQMFHEIMKIPLFISEKIFDAFCTQGSGLLSESDFVDGLTKLYMGSNEDVLKLVFKFYDFAKSGLLSKPNIKLLLSYIPLNNEDNVRFKYQLQSLDELEKVLKDLFARKTSMNYHEYLQAIQENNSDIFIILIGYLYKAMPFHIDSFEAFSLIKNSPQKIKRQLKKSPIRVPVTLPNQRISIRRPSIASGFFHSVEYVRRSYLSPETHSTNDEKIKLNHEIRLKLQDLGQFSKKKIIYFEAFLKDVIFKKVYLTVIGDDLYVFKSQNQDHLISMIPIKRIFAVEGKVVIDKAIYHTLTLHHLTRSNPNSIVLFFTSKDPCKKCLELIIEKNNQSIFNEKYQIKEVLGEGAFGIVKLALKNGTNEEVAVKILNKSKLKDSQIQMASHEVDIMRQCCHPNIVKLLEVHEDIENIYIVMEYIKGIDLFAYLDEYGPLPEKIIKQVIKQLGEAVKYLHTYGIVHRDLKLDNLFVAWDGIDVSNFPKINLKAKREASLQNVTLITNRKLSFDCVNTCEFKIKLGDFGISKVISNDYFLNDRIGTLKFTAPEIILGAKYNKQVDNWSLGIIMYLLYAGVFPFEDISEEKTVARIAYQELEFKEEIWEKASKDFKQLIAGCLEKDPHKRCTILKILKHDFLTKV